MKITVDELHSYMQCPAKYNFKHNKGIYEGDSKNIIFKKALHKTIYYFFYNVMNEQVPSLANLKDKWAAICSEMFDFEEEGVFSSRKGYIPRGKNMRKNPEFVRGMEMIHNFYQFNHKNPGAPIAVDHKYQVSFGDVVVEGTFELVREIVDEEDNRRYIEIVDYKVNDRGIDYFLVKNDLNLLLASYAFRNLFQAKEDRLKYHYMNTGRDIIVNKRDDNFRRIESVVEGISKGIEMEHFYPRQTFMCKGCELKDICDAAKF